MKSKAWIFLITGVIVFATVVAALFPPLVLEKIVDRFAENREVPLSMAFAYFGMLAASGILEAVQNVMITITGQKITHGVRSRMCAKLSRVRAGYFTANAAGKITSRFVNDVDTVDVLFTDGIIGMFADACKVLSILFVIFYKSRGLGILILCIVPVIFGLTRYFQKRMLKVQIANREAIGKVNNHVPETIRNMRSIRTLSIQGYMEEKYDEYIEDSYAALEKSNLYDAVYSPVVVFLSSCIIAVMMVCSSMGSAMQELFGITVGSAVAIIAYVGKVFGPLENIGMEIQNIQSAIAGLKRIQEFMKEEECFASERQELKGREVRFEGVDFSYDAERSVLTDLSFHVAEGENVTFMGRTGAGKSTVFKLILGLYRPDRGKVTIGGADAVEITGGQRRALIGYVEQQFHPVKGTIEDQIALFDENITHEQVEDAAKLVRLHEKIMALPEGYQTDMERADFSQGELQLLSIARAVAAKPQIMLLDEITANLDSVTERMILEVLQQASEGRTVISISHRLQEKAFNTRLISIGE